MASEKTNAQKAARHLDNLAVQFNDTADRDRSAAKLLSAAAHAIRKQEAENQALRDEVAALKAAAAESDAKVRNSLELAKKLLNRTHDIAAADKTGSVTANSAVRGNIDAAVKLLDNLIITANKYKPLDPRWVDLHDGRGLITPIATTGNVALIRALSERGADLNEVNFWGQTPLMVAAELGHLEIVRLLIEHGANTASKDSKGRTALDYARAHDRKEVEQLLERAGAEKPEGQNSSVEKTPGETEAPEAKVPVKVQEGEKGPLALLIDGSGSAVDSAGNGQPSILRRSLDATQVIAKDGASVSVTLWGAEKPVSVPVTKEGFEKVASGFGGGTAFASVLKHMKEAQSRHFVIITDGEFGDKESLLPETLEFLSANPRTTIDFVLISDKKDTAGEKLARALISQCPVQVTRRTVRKEDRVLSALREIADRRGSLRMSPDVRIMNTYYKKPGPKK